MSDHRHIKLNPLNPITKSHTSVNNFNSISINEDLRDSLTIDLIEFKESQSVCQTLMVSPTMPEKLNLSPKSKKRTVKRIQIKQEIPEKAVEIKMPDFWREIRVKIVKKCQIPYILTGAFRFVMWNTTLKKGIRSICNARKDKLKAVIIIQRN